MSMHTAGSPLRDKILKSKGKPGQIVNLKIDGEDVAIELRPPNMAQKLALAEKAGVDKDGNVKNPSAFPLAALIACAFEPGTTRRVFQAGDREALAEMGPEIDPALKAVSDLLRPPEDAAKNSESGPSAG